ncbi:MAG: hypothetical protein L3J91_04995 [Thermoplasmata archaeon]|nr:hypothetical protein [Thermoplasmata archaeon]
MVEFPGYQTMLRLGVGFTALGAALGVPVGLLSGAALLWTVPMMAGLNGFCGFAPLILVLLQRPWRYLVSLEIGPDTLQLRDSVGKASSIRWDDPDLSITILEPFGPLPSVGATGATEDLLIMPSRVDGGVGPAARAALLDAAAHHGLLRSDESFSVEGRRRGDPNRAVIAHTVARTALGAGFTDPNDAPVEAAAHRGWDGHPLSFDLAHVFPPRYDMAAPAPSNGLRAVTVSPAGLDLVDAKGRGSRCEWRDPKRMRERSRRLTSPLDRIDRPSAVWSLQSGSGRDRGAVDGTAAQAIAAAASSAGLQVVTLRFPGFQRPPTFWIARIIIRPMRTARTSGVGPPGVGRMPPLSGPSGPS